MFGKDPIVPLNFPLEPTVIYLGTDKNILTLEALKNMYQIVVVNLKLARKKTDTNAPASDRKLKEGDSALLRDHVTDVWESTYTGDYKIVSFSGTT